MLQQRRPFKVSFRYQKHRRPASAQPPLKKNGRATAASPRRGSDPPYPNVRHGNNRESNESRE